MSVIDKQATASIVTSEGGALTSEALGRMRAEFMGSRANHIAQNAVTQTTIDDVALNRRVLTSIDHTFSHTLDDWAVTNQKMSGRCWMFAGLNLFRVGAMQKMGIKEFEFSQNYVQFWDKLERANYMLEAIIETADLPVDDRVVAFLLSRPLDDGGQWNMFVNLVKKHGLVPKAFMPETESSSNTRRMNAMLCSRLRQGAKTLRDLHAEGASLDDIRAVKQEVLDAIYRMLSIHLGTPPERIEWQWTDDEGNFHRDPMMTPQEFAATYVTLPIDEYVCLVNDPRPDNPYGKTYTVQYLGNVVDGEIVTYLNVDVDLMKSLARQTIVDGQPVWFGCDVGKMMRRDLGVWDVNLMEYGALYDTEFTLTKAERLEYHETQMTHAMLFTGVDVVDGGARRWRVENSWGDENGRKGFFVMNDSWFDEYTFEIAAHKSLLPAELQQALGGEPVVLPAWDPMGALAR